MALKLELGSTEDAAEIAALRCAAAEKLTAEFGEGHWSSKASEKGVLWGMKRGGVYVARRRGKIAATLTLTRIKPWAIDRAYFTDGKRPLYLIAMAVAPEMQRQGVGRAAMADAERIARAHPAQSIRLDAYDAAAGAGEFYVRCGYTERGRVTYRTAPLIYFERVL